MISFVAALVALVLGAFAQYYLDKRIDIDDGLILYGMAILAILVAFRKQPQGRSVLPEAVGAEPRQKVRWPFRVLGLLIIILAFWAAIQGSGHLGGVVYKQAFRFEEGVLLWGLSFVFAAIGFAALEGKDFKAIFLRNLRSLRDSKLEIVIFILIMAFGVFVRVYQLDYFPPEGLAGDEGISGARSANIHRDPGYRTIYNSLSYYPIALTFDWFGISIINMRWSFVIVGILTLPAFYLLVRELYGFRPAAIATSLLAVSRWHASWGRLAIDWIYVPLLEVLALLFLFRGIHGKGKYNYFLAGACASLGLYSYVGFRIVPIIFSLFIVYKCIMQRRFLRQNFAGIAIFLTVMAIFAAPFLGSFVQANQRDFMERYDSIMAPVVNNAASGKQNTVLIEKAKATFFRLVMDGDTWGASNLPKSSMLDSVTAMLFVLGLGYCTVFWWRNENFLYATTFYSTAIVGGVLTINPLAQRFVGVLPVVIICAALVVDGMWTRFAGVVGSRRALVLAVPTAAILVLSGWINYDLYFNRQVHASETRLEFLRNIVVVSNHIGSFADDHHVFLMADFPFFYPLHDFGWIAKFPPGRQSDFIANVAPTREDIGSRNVAFVISSPFDWDASLDYLQHIYPGGEVITQSGPLNLNWWNFGSYRVKRDEVLKRRGLTATYSHATEGAEGAAVNRLDKGINFVWKTSPPPVEAPFTAVWQGSVFVQKYGDYMFGLEATGGGTVSVDEEVLVTKEATATASVSAASRRLGIGWHRIQVDYFEEDMAGSVKLIWQGPETQRSVVPENSLSTLFEDWGLEGTYYRGTEWSGNPALTRLDPFVGFFWRGRPVPEPYSVEWNGALRVDQAGKYAFAIEQVGGGAQLFIDGSAVVDTPGLTIRPRNEGTVDLSDGEHAIKVKYFFKGGEAGRIRLLWTPPNGQKKVVPSSVLSPEIPTGQTIPVSAETAPIPTVGPAATPVIDDRFTIWGGLQSAAPGEFSWPRDIAFDSEGNMYVADEGNKRIQKFDPEGKYVLSWDGFERQDRFTNPPAVSVNRQDEVIVLDGEAGWMGAFDGEGKLIRKWPSPKPIYHPRGLALDNEGNVYLIDTGFSKVLKFGPDGGFIAEIALSGAGKGQVNQPTDAEVDRDGNIYVVDQGNKRIQVLKADGSYLREWQIPHSGSGNATHIAIAEDGTIYATHPEAGKIVQYDTTGKILRQWGERGSRPGQFLLPTGITIDKEGRIFVADSQNHRIVRFAPD